VQTLWQGSWIAAWAVGVLTWGLMLWAAVAYRRRHREQIPVQTRYNLPIEILYTVVPLIMILGLFWFTARDQSELLTVKNDQQQTVQVVGYRWSWGFNYLDQDVYSTGMPVGQGTTNEPPTLVLPVGQKVRFELQLLGCHPLVPGAGLPVQDGRDPGPDERLRARPRTRSARTRGKCAELCGVDHARMLFQVKVVEQAEFDAYIEGLKERGQTGLLQTGRINLDGEVPGEKRI
jgi:cytochrome c oxidase subunit 2